MIDIAINKKQLGYKPELEYVDSYESTTVNSYNEESNTGGITPDEENIVPDKAEVLLNSLGSVNILISTLPNVVGDALLEVFKPVEDFIIDDLKDKIYPDIPDEVETEYKDKEEDKIYPNIPGGTGTDDKEDDKIPPNITGGAETDDKEDDTTAPDPWGTDDFFEVVITTHDKEEIIEKEYTKNLTDLFIDYVNTLKKAISDFWKNWILAMGNKTNSDIDFINSNIILSSKDIKINSKHLLDSALREQIYKDYKFDYYTLNFTLEETFKQLNNFKAVKELRLRYYSIKEEKGNTKSNQMNNNILKIARLTYDNYYNTSFESLYRYLNSSNIVVKEIFATWTHEIKSKQILIEKGGIL